MTQVPFRVGDVVNYAFDAPFPIRQRVHRWIRAALRAVGVPTKQRFFRVARVDEGSITLEVVEA